MGSRRKARIYAMQALFSHDMSKVSREQLLELEWIEDKKAPEDTLAFARLLIAGAMEHLPEIDTTIQKHLEHWEIGRLARVDLAILRLGTYSLLYQGDIPASITIDEAVDMAKEFAADDSYRFVNGVLDSIRKDAAGTAPG